MFIRVTDKWDGHKMLLNAGEIAMVDESGDDGRDGCVVYLKSVVSDSDGSRQQVKVYVAETYDYFTKILNVY